MERRRESYAQLPLIRPVIQQAVFRL